MIERFHEGVRMVRRSIEHRRGATPDKVVRARQLRRAMTPAERLLWARLRRDALGVRARAQHVIRGWIVDFYLPAASLVVELDGDVHDLQVDEDERRTQSLYEEGVTVIRVRNDDVLNGCDEVVARIADHVSASRGPRVPRRK